MPRSIILLTLCCLLMAMASDATVVPMLIAERVDANNRSVERNTASRKVIDYLALKSGVRFELQPYPWKRALLLAESADTASAIWGVSRTPEREQIFAFSHAVFSKNIWMIVRKDETIEIRSIADLAGKHISLFRGASYGAEFDKARDKNLFTVEEDTNSWEIRFSKLLAGRCDVMLAAATSSSPQKAEHFFARYGYNPKTMRILEKPLFADSLHIAILKSKLATFPMEPINAAIDAGHADIERLIED